MKQGSCCEMMVMLNILHHNVKLFVLYSFVFEWPNHLRIFSHMIQMLTPATRMATGLVLYVG